MSHSISNSSSVNTSSSTSDASNIAQAQDTQDTSQQQYLLQLLQQAYNQLISDTTASDQIQGQQLTDASSNNTVDMQGQSEQVQQVDGSAPSQNDLKDQMANNQFETNSVS